MFTENEHIFCVELCGDGGRNRVHTIRQDRYAAEHRDEMVEIVEAVSGQSVPDLLGFIARSYKFMTPFAQREKRR